MSDPVKKISVIIPVYNTEKYLGECLDSVLNQSFRDIEVIAVNDGSTDNSLKILEEHAQKDPRLIIVNQKNSGLSMARNAGLNAARGVYVHFLDSDDFVSSDFYKRNIETVESQNADLVYFRVVKWKAGKETEEIKFDGDSIPLEAWSHSSACAYLFKRRLVEEENFLRFEPVRIEEDNQFSFMLFRRLHSFAKEQKATLYYRQYSADGKNLMTWRRKNPKIFQQAICHHWELLLRYAQQLSVTERQKTAVAHLRFFGMQYKNLCSVVSWSDWDIPDKMRKEVCKLFPEEMIENRKNLVPKKYRYYLYHQGKISFLLFYLRKRMIQMRFSKKEKYLIIFGKTVFRY
ncbi:MAG: glycosyltransferase family 2 protein [Thermoguttaceae bacterium]|nr:glycosyltransferase family 2 protein [Thermoguttaceae bacterium]